MCDNLVILNLQYFKRDSYISVICQASDSSGRQKSRCGCPPSGLLGVKIQEPAFWGDTHQRERAVVLRLLFTFCPGKGQKDTYKNQQRHTLR